MENKYDDAIDAIKKNYPPANRSMLREALDLAIKALEQIKQIESAPSELPELRNEPEYRCTGIGDCVDDSEYFANKGYNQAISGCTPIYLKVVAERDKIKKALDTYLMCDAYMVSCHNCSKLINDMAVVELPLLEKIKNLRAERDVLKERVNNQQIVIDKLKAEPKEIVPVLYGVPGVSMKPVNIVISELEKERDELKAERDRFIDQWWSAKQDAWKLKEERDELRHHLKGTKELSDYRFRQSSRLRKERDELKSKYDGIVERINNMNVHKLKWSDGFEFNNTIKDYLLNDNKEVG